MSFVCKIWKVQSVLTNILLMCVIVVFVSVVAGFLAVLLNAYEMQPMESLKLCSFVKYFLKLTTLGTGKFPHHFLQSKILSLQRGLPVLLINQGFVIS